MNRFLVSKIGIALVVIFALFFPLVFKANAATFLFSDGVIKVLDDGTVSDTFEQTKKEFVDGQPAILFDATAVQSGDNGAVGVTPSHILHNGTLNLEAGTLYIGF